MSVVRHRIVVSVYIRFYWFVECLVDVVKMNVPPNSSSASSFSFVSIFRSSLSYYKIFDYDDDVDVYIYMFTQVVVVVKRSVST